MPPHVVLDVRLATRWSYPARVKRRTCHDGGFHGRIERLRIAGERRRKQNRFRIQHHGRRRKLGQIFVPAPRQHEHQGHHPEHPPAPAAAVRRLRSAMNGHERQLPTFLSSND